MAKSGSETPLMQQHSAIKQRYPDAILLFRVGDFYETFGEDAIIAAKVLGITLTKRNNGSASASELAGFPHHSLDTYLHKLVKAGYRVAVCDQLEDPKQAKGIVKRGVTELVTPGVATNDKLLEHNSNNFLAGIHIGEKQYGIAFLDISTGEFMLAEGQQEYIDRLLQTLKPAEVIFQRSFQKQFKDQYANTFYTYTLDQWIFDEAYATESILKHFQTHSLKGFGIENMPEATIAAGAVLHYLKDTEHPNLQHITQIQRIDQFEHLWMDRFTIRNLELIHPDPNAWHLLRVIDQTITPMGARMLKRWVLMPLCKKEAIEERLHLVQFFHQQQELREKLSPLMKQCGDIERLVSKIPPKKINPREVLQIAKGLKEIQQIKELVSGHEEPYLQKLAVQLNALKEVATKIEDTVMENPPAVAAKGGFIRDGIHVELDKLRGIATNGKEYLATMQQKEADTTGISSLKIGFNNVFGYYLEVTNSQKSKVPSGWIRKQTLANAERYITPELKEYEEQITGAEDKIQAIELELYDQLVQSLMEFIQPMQTNAYVIGVLDCLTNFAGIAQQYNYVAPELHEGRKLSVKDARHPVIERNLPVGESYIANDILLDPDAQQIIILTGPNMSGKSAILRQTALITIMAHMGSFVPASAAQVPVTDKIFTRVGASDNLSGGESTFMVEMNETASIINNLSSNSLILLDEIGRGTSTYDGISIAWSIVEYLHNSNHQPKTLFATHYHELNELENKLSRVKNFHVTNKEVGNKIIFLRKLAPGGSTHSFGIHVAKMAGMPPSLINRANEILEQLEVKHVDGETAIDVKNIGKTEKLQLSIFDAHSETFESIRKTLNDIDINRLTPVEALLKLQEIKEKVK
jgi:DNA mismatch repair protein MutS